MKKVIILGDFGYFPDSLRYFVRKGFELYRYKLNTKLDWFNIPDGLCKDIGINNIKPNNIEAIYRLLDEDTIVLSGPSFMGHSFSYSQDSRLLKYTNENMNLIYNVSKYNKENDAKSYIIRYFNGDIDFGNQKEIDFFDKCLQYVDLFIFDNDLLREFIIKNSTVVKNKKTIIAWLETPLEKYVTHNIKPIEKRIISLGRCLSSFDEIRRNEEKLPITFFPRLKQDLTLKEKLQIKLTHKKVKYKLSGACKNMNRLLSHRKYFLKHESMCAFGMSHLHDIFYNSVENFKNHKDFFFTLEGQQYANNAGAPKEMYYAFLNNPNKEARYLMYGIIPLISHSEHSYYKALLDKKMAILIKNKEDLKNVLKMSNSEIQEYRDNIYRNRDLFTFDHVGEILCKLFEENKAKRVD